MLFCSRVGAEAGDPVSSVFSLPDSAEPEGDVVFLTEVDVGLDGGDIGGFRPVLVEGVGGVRVVGWAEDSEVGIPLGAAEEEDVWLGSMGRMAAVSFFIDGAARVWG